MIWPNYNDSPTNRFPWNLRGFPFLNATFWGPRSCINSHLHLLHFFFLANAPRGCGFEAVDGQFIRWNHLTDGCKNTKKKKDHSLNHETTAFFFDFAELWSIRSWHALHMKKKHEHMKGIVYKIIFFLSCIVFAKYIAVLNMIRTWHMLPYHGTSYGVFHGVKLTSRSTTLGSGKSLVRMASAPPKFKKSI